MVYRTDYSLVTWALIAALSLAGVSCSSSPETEEEVEQTESTTPDVVDAYRAGAPWIPRDVNAVVAGSWTPVWEALGEEVLPTARPDAEPGSVGTVEGVRSDFEAIFRERFGFDPGPTDTVAVGLSPNTRVAVVFGDFEEPETAAGSEVAGRDVYNVEIGAAGPVSTMVAAVVDEPRRGLLVARDTRQLKSAIEARNADNTLRASATGEQYTRLFEEAEGGTVGAAFALGPMSSMVQAGVPVPDSGVVAYRPDRIEALVEGDPEVLDSIEEMVSDFVSRSREETAEQFDDTEPGTVENLGAIYTRHLSASLSDQLEPGRSEGQLRYDVELTGDVSRSYLFGAVAAGVAVPAFLWMEQHQTTQSDQVVEAQPVSEPEIPDETAEQLLSKAVQEARGYFQSEQVYSRVDGPEPWHEATEWKPGVPVEFDDKTFPGGPGIRLETSAEVPVPDQPLEPEPGIVEGTVDFEAADVLEQLGVELGEITSVRLVYETGPGTGSDATATIRVDVDTDPATPDEYETYVQELEIDSRYGVSVGPVRAETRQR